MITFNIEAPSIDKGAFECLFNNLDLIRSNKKFIMSRKKYRNIKIDGIYAAGIYVGGNKISLGVLLDLWDKTVWHTDNKFYFNVIGSPLSGTNHCGWFDADTQKFEYGRVQSWHYLARPAFKIISESRDTKDRQKQLAKWREKNKREQCNFAQWSKKVDTDKIKHIPQPMPSPTLTIYQLVDLLKQRNTK